MGGPWIPVADQLRRTRELDRLRTIRGLTAEEIAELIRKHGRIAIRLHVLGDFGSEKDLDLAIDYVAFWRWAMMRFEGELYSSLPFLTFRLPFRLFDLVPHFGGGDPLVLRTVGEDAAGDRVEGFQDFSHAIRAL